MSYNTCEKTGKGNIITAEGRLAYAQGIYKASIPKGETDQSRAKFQASIVFPVGTDLTALNDAIEAAAVEKFGAGYAKKYKIRRPFLKVADYPAMGFEPEKYETFVRASSTDKPGVVDASTRKVDESSAIYSGRWARLSLRAFSYDHPTGGKGVSLGLQNVQLLRDDEPVGATRVAAQDEFSAVTLAPGQSADKLFANLQSEAP